jgi:hypothetical protein
MLTYLILAITIGTHITGAHSATHTTYDNGMILQKSVLGMLLFLYQLPVRDLYYTIHNDYKLHYLILKRLCHSVLVELLLDHLLINTEEINLLNSVLLYYWLLCYNHISIYQLPYFSNSDLFQ